MFSSHWVVAIVLFLIVVSSRILSATAFLVAFAPMRVLRCMSRFVSLAVPKTWLDVGCSPFSFHHALVNVVFLCVFPTVEVVGNRRLVSSDSFWFRKVCWVCSIFRYRLISMLTTTLGMVVVCFSIECFAEAVLGRSLFLWSMMFVLLPLP